MTNRSAVEDAVGAVALLDEPKRRQLYDLVAASDESGRPRRGGGGAGDEPRARRLPPRSPRCGRAARHGVHAARWPHAGPGPVDRPSSTVERTASCASHSRPVITTSWRNSWRLHSIGCAAKQGRRGSGSRCPRAKATPQARPCAGASVRDRVPAGCWRASSTSFVEPATNPSVDTSTGTLALRNCPYRALTAEHRELTCGMNIAWAEGVVHGLGSRSERGARSGARSLLRRLPHCSGQARNRA